MFEQYNNIFLSNNMNGAQSHCICDCGHDEYGRYHSICPSCGALKNNFSDDLRLNDIDFSQSSYTLIEDKTKLYAFTMIFVRAQGSYRINFSKKKIGKYKLKEHNVLAIMFDAHKPFEEMIQFYDVSNQQYLTEQEFMQIASELNTYFNGVVIHDFHNRYIKDCIIGYDYNIKINKKLLTSFKHLADYCATPVNEILIKAGVDPQKVIARELNTEGTNPMDILGIKKYTYKQLLKYEQNIDTFMTLKNLEKMLGDKAVPYMDKFVQKNNSLWLNSNVASNVITLINEANLSVEKLFKYIYKDVPEQQYLYAPSKIVSYLCDSFRMCKQLGLTFDKAPKALVRYHDVLTKEINLCKDRQNDETIKNVARKYSHLEKITELDEEGKCIDKYSILIAKSATDIVQEGKNMHHCVGSYVNKMMNEDCVILFLRMSKVLDLSFITIEYNPHTNSIVQIKASQNRKADKEVIDYIQKWAKEKNIVVSSIY